VQLLEELFFAIGLSQALHANINLAEISTGWLLTLLNPVLDNL